MLPLLLLPQLLLLQRYGVRQEGARWDGAPDNVHQPGGPGIPGALTLRNYLYGHV